MRIALIGCGAMGTALLDLVRDDPGLQVAAIVVSSPAVHLATPHRLVPAAVLCTAVPPQGIDLLVECAGHTAVEQHVLGALARGVPAILASVGALSAPGLLDRLEAAARRGRTQVQLIAGAIGAIDALEAARIGGLASVRYTGRKPPQAWKGTPAEQRCVLDALTQATVVFEGTARMAAARFPKNANVAATVALAGLGLDETQVCLIADPAVADNVHQLDARGTFGEFSLTLRNKPLPANP